MFSWWWLLPSWIRVLVAVIFMIVAGFMVSYYDYRRKKK